MPSLVLKIFIRNHNNGYTNQLYFLHNHRLFNKTSPQNDVLTQLN